MEIENNIGPIVEIEGAISSGKQYDIEITLPEDNRSVIYGIIKDAYDEPVRDAVVKLIEVDTECGKEERKPVTHTFTDREGEFVFGPLCANKHYEIQVWANDVKHRKICAECHHKGKCLKGVKLDCDKKDCFLNTEARCENEEQK